MSGKEGRRHSRSDTKKKDETEQVVAKRQQEIAKVLDETPMTQQDRDEADMGVALGLDYRQVDRVQPDQILEALENVGGIVFAMDSRDWVRQVNNAPTLEGMAQIVPGGMARLKQGMVILMDKNQTYGQILYINPDLKVGDFVEINKLHMG